MIPLDVYPTLFLNNNCNYILFKTAIYFAELGMNVWCISPTVFDKIPENVEPPDKEILQSITFVYLQDYKALINHLNAIHLWHKVPRVVIILGLEKYTKILDETYNPVLSAMILTTILDSVSVCVKRNQKSTFVIVSSVQLPQIYKNRLQVIGDLYFLNVIENDDSAVVLNQIIDYYKNK